jgi:hypothetical protein
MFFQIRHFMARVRYDLDFDVIALPENVTAVTAEYDHVNKEIWIASSMLPASI